MCISVTLWTTHMGEGPSLGCSRSLGSLSDSVPWPPGVSPQTVSSDGHRLESQLWNPGCLEGSREGIGDCWQLPGEMNNRGKINKDGDTRMLHYSALDSLMKGISKEYLFAENHEIDWEGAQIFDREGDCWRIQKTKVAIYIGQQQSTMNRDPGGYLSRIYDPVLFNDS